MTRKLITVIIIVVAVLVTAVGGAATAGIIIYNNQPENVALRAIGGAVTGFLEREEFEFFNQVSKSGSVEFEVGDIYYEGENILNLSAEGKLYLSEQGFMAEGLDLRLANGERIAGDIYATPDFLYVSERYILDGSYAINTKTALDEFSNSIFVYGSGSQYAISEEKYSNAVKTAFGEDESYEDRIDGMSEILTKHLKEFWKLFCEQADFTSEIKTVEIGDTNEERRVISISMKGYEVAYAIEDYTAFLMSDGDIFEHLENHKGHYTLSFYSSLGEDKDIKTGYINYLAELERDLEKVRHEIEEYDHIEIELVTPKRSADLLRFEIEVDEERFVLDFGPDGAKKSKKITAETSDGELEMVLENSDYEYYLNISSDGEDLVTLEVDKEYETFCAGIPGNMIDGSYKRKDRELDIEITSWTMKPEGSAMVSVDTDVSFVLKAQDKMPKAPDDFENISAITDSDVKRWIERFGN